MLHLIRVLFPTFLRKKLFSYLFFRRRSDGLLLSGFDAQNSKIYSIQNRNRSSTFEYLNKGDLIYFWKKLKKVHQYIIDTDFNIEKFNFMVIHPLSPCISLNYKKSKVFYKDLLISKENSNRKLDDIVEIYILDLSNNSVPNPRILLNCSDFELPQQLIYDDMEPLSIIENALNMFGEIFEKDDSLRFERDKCNE